MFRALHGCCLRSLIHFNLAYSTLAPETSISLPSADKFPEHHTAGRRKRPGLSPHSLIFFVRQRFDQPLCRRPPAWKGRDDDAGTAGGEIAVEGAPDISTVARGNERSRQLLAYRILSTLDFAVPYQVSQCNKFIAV